MNAPSRSRRRRLWLLIAALALLIPLLPVLVGAALLVGLTLPQCGGSVTPPVPYEDVSFPSAEFGRPTRAFFIPGAATGDAPRPVVIVVPTLAQGRGDRMAEALVYHTRGLHVLTYESRACVGGAGPSLGAAEAGQVGDALAHLAARPEVDRARIGLHGFSAGGAAALLAAAQYPSVAAVVAQGNYADFEALLTGLSVEFGLLKPGFDAGARLGYRLSTGRALADLSPLAAMSRIAPRPVLLVYGSAEPGAAYAMQMVEAGTAAGGTVTLWVIPGAGHGDYAAVAGEDYAERVGGFMAAALGQ